MKTQESSYDIKMWKGKCFTSKLNNRKLIQQRILVFVYWNYLSKHKNTECLDREQGKVTNVMGLLSKSRFALKNVNSAKDGETWRET